MKMEKYTNIPRRSRISRHEETGIRQTLVRYICGLRWSREADGKAREKVWLAGARMAVNCG